MFCSGDVPSTMEMDIAGIGEDGKPLFGGYLIHLWSFYGSPRTLTDSAACTYCTYITDVPLHVYYLSIRRHLACWVGLCKPGIHCIDTLHALHEDMID